MIHFNYNIGDKVKLTNKVLCSEKVYTIDGVGWKDAGDGPVPFYKVYAYCDECLPYHNRLSESDITPVGDAHPFDEDTDFYSTDGSLINIGDKVYYDLYGYYNEANIRFIFTGYGTVTEKHYFKCKDSCLKSVVYRREFLCTRENGEPWLDGRAYGLCHTESIRQITKVVPDDYAELYVNTLFKHRESYLLDKEKSYEYFDIKSWLEHIGIFDKVMDLYNKRKSVDDNRKTEKKKSTSKKPSSKKSKLEKMISGLSEKDKEELKKMLNQ